ncbi:aminotransferase class I/II [Natronococcus pandeyae]|uniref:Aminotransferase n=2 Tax=Natronococcus pandeyae TaxID=2055836 RepID=A0A8J8PZC7_9EURY|nr:aminotransferase class I/II [Natronococcus pandeyae]
MFDLAQERSDEDLVHLEIGEPDFDTPQHIVAAAHEATSGGATHYTSNAGLHELRDTIAAWASEKRDLSLDPANEITVTTGAMEALHLAAIVLADAGEEVVIPTPAWPNYVAQASLADATPVTVPLSADDGFRLDADRVVKAIGDETAFVVLTSPSNPTGQVHEPREIRVIIEAAADHDAFVVADEVYSGLEYDGESTSMAAISDHPERVLTVDSVSKKYAMTGWRVGWLAGAESIIDQVTKLHESTTACAPTPCQHAAVAALSGPQDPAAEMLSAFAERRDYLLGRIDEIPNLACPEPNGAFYAFLDVREIDEPSMTIAERLLEEYGVVTAPGSGFGSAGEGHLRVSFANSLDQLEAGFDAIERFVQSEVGR